MADREDDNVHIFPGQPKTSAKIRAAVPDLKESEAVCQHMGIGDSDLRAMAACLERLCADSSRLDATTATRLIGAAALALTSDPCEPEG